MTNGKVYQGFRDDKKVEEHWCKILSPVTMESTKFG